jgi:hypothetical protein
VTGRADIIGRVIEAGDLAALGGQPGILIAVEREALRDYPDNLFGARVRVGRAGDRETRDTASKGER